jgi:hypothetical protein
MMARRHRNGGGVCELLGFANAGCLLAPGGEWQVMVDANYFMRSLRWLARCLQLPTLFLLFSDDIVDLYSCVYGIIGW